MTEQKNSKPIGYCGNATCVQVEVQDGGVVKVDSTVEGNEGFVYFTWEEWDAFIEKVEAGAFDATVRNSGAARQAHVAFS